MSQAQSKASYSHRRTSHLESSEEVLHDRAQPTPLTLFLFPSEDKVLSMFLLSSTLFIATDIELHLLYV